LNTHDSRKRLSAFIKRLYSISSAHTLTISGQLNQSIFNPVTLPFLYQIFISPETEMFRAFFLPGNINAASK